MEEIPASFGFDSEDHIEIHFYTVPGKIRLISTIVSITDNILKSHIVSYNDGTFKNYLQIDFTKLFIDKNIVLIPGDYQVVINFFSDEIGSYTDRILSIAEITPSRKEVELQFNNENSAQNIQKNEELFREFINKSFTKTDTVGVIQKIFKSGIELDSEAEGITAERLLSDINNLSPTLSQTFDTTVARIERAGLITPFVQQINEFIPTLASYIIERIVSLGDERIQKDELMAEIQLMVNQQINKLQGTVDSRIRVS